MYVGYCLLFAICLIFVLLRVALGLSCCVCCALFLNVAWRALIVDRGLLVVVCGLLFGVCVLFVVVLLFVV